MTAILILGAMQMITIGGAVAALLLYLESRPIRIQVIGTVALAENGATLRQAGNSIAHSVFSGTSLVASVIQAATRKEDSERHH